MKYALRACEIFAPSGQIFRCAVGHGTFLWGCATEMNLWRAAVAASAPSEEGAGVPKGFRGATEGERTRGCCLHKGVDVHKFIQVSFLLCVRLYKVLLHTLGVSLLPSRRFYPLYAVPPPSSEGGKGAPAPCAHILISPASPAKLFLCAFYRL